MIYYLSNHSKIHLGKRILYIGKFDSLVKPEKWKEFYNNGDEQWECATRLIHAIQSGFSFNIVEIITNMHTNIQKEKSEFFLLNDLEKIIV